MKKILLSLTLLLSAVIQVNEVKAQINPKIGVRLGYNFTSYNSYKHKNDSPAISLLGVYAVFPINKTSFSIQPEMLATQRAAAINNVGVKLSYIQVPVFARVDFANGSLLSPHLYLGPYIAFNISAKENHVPSTSPFRRTPPAEENIPPPNEVVNHTIFGLAMGLGVDVSQISFGIRFSQSITKTFEIGEARNTAISIVAAFHF